MHLPEAVFGDNRIVLTHRASGFTLAFTAEGALRCWARDSVVEESSAKETDGARLRTSAAQLPAWRQRMLASTLRTSTAVDWTFCCGEYGGEPPEEANDDETILDAASMGCQVGCQDAGLAPMMSGLGGLGGLVGLPEATRPLLGQLKEGGLMVYST